MIAEELKKIITGEVSTEAEVLEKYSEDASIFKIKPEAVVFPKNIEDIKSIVKLIAKKKKKNQRLSISARSAGTDMTGGPLTESIVLEFSRYFNKVKEVRYLPKNKGGYAVTEPGVYYRDFERKTLEKKLIFPPYPASREICAMGGIVSNNSAGEKTLALGQTKDYIMEVKVVLSDGSECVFRPVDEWELKKKIAQKNLEGKIYKKIWALIKKNQKLIWESKPAVSKNSAGYLLWEVYDGKYFDLSKLIVGSQGTLAIITEAKLRLVKALPHSRMVVIFLKDISAVGRLVNIALKFKPESIESYDDKTLLLALKFLPGLAKSLRKKGYNLMKLIFSFLPDLRMLLTSGFPKMVLLVEFTGDDEMKVSAASESLTQELKRNGFKARATKNKAEGEKYWTIRRESFSLLREKIKDKHTAPFIDDVIVNPEHMPEFLPRLNTLVSKYPELTYTIAGHAGNGNFHVIPLADFTNPKLKDIIANLSEEVYNLVQEYNGSITAEHNDGLIRTPYLNKMFSEKMIKIFAETKKAFDPQNIFNPGKKTAGDLEYALSHIKKE